MQVLWTRSLNSRQQGPEKWKDCPCTVIRKGLCSLFEYCVSNVTFDQPSHWISLVETEKENQKAPKLECFEAREYVCTWASLWFFIFFLYRGGMLCTLWKAITDFREKHAWHWNISSLLWREENISFQRRAGVLSEGLLHFNPVFVYQC